MKIIISCMSWVLKLVFLWSNKELVSLLRGLGAKSNVFMTSSCLALPGLSLRPTEKKTCFAASVSGLWLVLRADGQVSSYLHPVSTTRCSLGKWLYVLLKNCWPPNLFFCWLLVVYKGLYEVAMKCCGLWCSGQQDWHDMSWTWNPSKMINDEVKGQRHTDKGSKMSVSR